MTAGMDGWLKSELGVDEGVAPAEEISTPIIFDEKLYLAVKDFANNPPEGWASIKNVDVNEMLVNAEEFVLIDARRADEFEAGYIDPAVNIPLEEVISRMGEIDPNAKNIVYCKSGIRSLIYTIALRMNGYNNVLSMSGGYVGWEAAELPVVTP
jgi:rhodanese-related sulfurtransferase